MIETKDQFGKTIFRKSFTMNDVQYKNFKNLPLEEDWAWNFWKELGEELGFDPKIIECIKEKGKKTYWKGIEYIPNTRQRSFSALTY